MAENYLKMFERKFYPPAFSQMANETIQAFEDNVEHIIKELQRKVQNYLLQIVDLQEKGLAGAVSELTLSLLYTSLDTGTEFQLDCYEGAGRVYSESICTDRMPVPWLTQYLDGFIKELGESAAREGIRQFVRPAEMDVLKLRAARSLMYYFAGRFKYYMNDILDAKTLAKIIKEDSFVVEIGEYLDWQKAVFAILPEVDIFNCTEETNFRFRRFPAYYYQKKKFQKLDIRNARFTDCTFIEGEIDDCVMNDCIFDGCTFEKMTICKTKMIGCVFLDCKIREAYFSGVNFYIHETEQIEEYYEPAEFYRCEITDSRMEKCNLSACEATDCEIQNLEISQSKITASAFSEMNGVIRKETSEV